MSGSNVSGKVTEKVTESELRKIIRITGTAEVTARFVLERDGSFQPILNINGTEMRVVMGNGDFRSYRSLSRALDKCKELGVSRVTGLDADLKFWGEGYSAKASAAAG